MPQPSSIRELQFFLSMVNYHNKYSPGLTELGDSLRESTKESASFVCSPEHTEAFEVIRKEITSGTILKHCDPSKPLTCKQMQA